MRMYRAAHSAPEELLDVAPQDRKPQNRRADFTDGVWFSVSVGRKQNAEPRWLLPMLCKAGGITKTEIGAIRIDQNETYVELSADSVDGFIAAIGPDHKVEKNVTVTRLDEKPQIPQRQHGGKGGSSDRHNDKNKDRTYGKKKSFRDRKPAGGRKPRPDRGFTPEADTPPQRPDFKKPKRRKKPETEGPGDNPTPKKSKLSPAQKKRKKLKKQLRKQGRS